VESETPAVAASPLAGMRQHDVARRIADRHPNAFENDQRSRRRPIRCQGECGYGSHLDDVAEDRNRPVAICRAG
jgi:hypothetical protein